MLIGYVSGEMYVAAADTPAITRNMLDLCLKAAEQSRPKHQPTQEAQL